jgi:hypothetical protein
MCMKNNRLQYVGLLVMALAVGCSKAPERPAAGEEEAARKTFAELQSAIKSQDADKLWMLLDSKSQADAERAAKDIQTAHRTASAEEKSKQEESLGMPGAELTGLTGKGFFKTKRFQKKYHEFPESSIEKIVVQGDNAAVHFLEPDGDHEKMIFVRKDGQWKAWLPLPKVRQP